MAESELGARELESRRPLSPHLQIYRPMLTMVMSIAHRITGAALYLGTLLLAWFLISAANGPESYANVTAFAGSLSGRVILFGFSWAFFHHLLGGLRHILWDSGYGFSHPQREWLAQATLIGGILLTLASWGLSLFVL